MQNKNSITGWIVAAIIIILGYIGLFYLSNKGITIGEDRNNIKQVNALKELGVDSKIFNEIPDMIDSGVLEYRVENKTYCVYAKGYALKAVKFIDKNFDVLGLGNSSESDIIENGVRIRVGYKDYPKTTIYNWYDDKYNYGLMINNKINNDSILKVIVDGKYQ